MATGTNTRPPPAVPARIRWPRVAILVAAAIALYVLGRLAADLVIGELDLHLRAYNEPLLHRTIMTAMVTYTVLMAIPFMPAVEIGLSALMIFGGRLAFLVYLSTVAALLASYAIGRLFSPDLMATAFAMLGFRRASVFIDRLVPLSPSERLALLVRESPTRLLPILIRHRFLALAILLNVPGNVVLGGGGGIALAAGMSRLFPFPIYALTVACAVAPVPLMIFLTEHAWK